ncbi:hypothetical protein JHK87_050631 [Glycine soja]|nr:hypothetical protein JHK87_050631 [Glycine soja]
MSKKPKDGSESDGVRVVRVVSDDGDQGGQSRVTLDRVTVPLLLYYEPSAKALVFSKLDAEAHFCRVGADAAMDLLPQGHQSLKYDLLHSVHLNLEGLDEQFKVAQALANGVIPNVYGINRKQKLKIGSKLYCFEDRGHHRVALRLELTPSLARLVIEKGFFRQTPQPPLPLIFQVQGEKKEHSER